MNNNESYDGIVYRYKNFITSEECKVLTDWALNNQNNYLPGVTNQNNKIVPYDSRISTRANKNVKYPLLIKEIQNKIMQKFNTKDKFDAQGTDGIISSITFENGNVYKHIDGGVDLPNCGRFNFNILVSKPEKGGELIINNKEYEFNSGDLIGFFASKYEHEVKTCYGNIPRILFMFGFAQPLDWSPL